MNVRPFIPKDNYEMPDFYTITLVFVSGREKEIKAVSHKIIPEFFDRNENGQIIRNIPLSIPILEVITHDNEIKTYPVSSIEEYALDKNFTKIKELYIKKEQKNAKKKDNSKKG